MGSSEIIFRGHESQSTSDGSYSPKHAKRWVPSPVSYLLSEQRLLFVLVGMAVASLVFVLSPASVADPYAASAAGSHIVARSLSVGPGRHVAGGAASQFRHVAGRVPLGLRRKRLRVVVTGGAGFVGSHLVDRLMERGDSVIVVDNFFTGRKENVMHHFGSPNFELIRHDVVEPLLLEVDQIYHLACPASPVHYKFNPVKTIKTNVVGTLNMLGLAKRVGARFLLTSTSEVYGDPLQHPQVETYWGNVNPIGVRSCYDEGKRTAETLAMDYHRGAQVEVRIARIFNTYGPRMCIDDGRVVSNFVAQALRKEPMTVYGDGKQTRSFQYVSDLVEGLMKLQAQTHHQTTSHNQHRHPPPLISSMAKSTAFNIPKQHQITTQLRPPLCPPSNINQNRTEKKEEKGDAHNIGGFRSSSNSLSSSSTSPTRSHASPSMHPLIDAAVPCSDPPLEASPSSPRHCSTISTFSRHRFASSPPISLHQVPVPPIALRSRSTTDRSDLNRRRSRGSGSDSCPAASPSSSPRRSRDRAVDVAIFSTACPRSTPPEDIRHGSTISDHSALQDPLPP